MIPLVAAWVGHTDASRGMAHSFTAALAHHEVKHETASELLRLSDPEDLSKQLRGLKPFNAWRVGYLAVDRPDVYLTYLRFEARRMGAELITPDERALLVGFASATVTAGKKRMAQMFPAIFQQERKRA